MAPQDGSSGSRGERREGSGCQLSNMNRMLHFLV
jgi:hypothetical protein